MIQTEGDDTRIKIKLNNDLLHQNSIRKLKQRMINSAAVSGDHDGLSNQDGFTSRLSVLNDEEAAPYLTSILDIPETPVGNAKKTPVAKQQSRIDFE